MIERIIKDEKACTGCSACYNICPCSAIQMKLINGFYKPVINESRCLSCGKCISICPQNNEIKKSDYKTVAFACKNKNSQIRMQSSSGGIFSILSENVLLENGIIYGVAFDDKFMAKHIKIDSISELSQLRRSKYLQSYIGDIFKSVKNDLVDGRTVLFSGTPCQCAGLNAYLNNDYNNLIIAEVLCHGTPSPIIWENYLHYRKKKSKSTKIIECKFRTKNTSPKASWNNSFMYLKFDNNSYNVNSLHDPYMMLFARSNVILNDSCYECRYRKLIKRGYVDISLSDFWNINTINKTFDDEKGVSLLMIHSKKAEKLFEKCKNEMESISVQPQDGVNLNSSSKQPQKYSDSIMIRDYFINNPNKFGLIYRAYLPIIYIRKIFNKIKTMLSKL